MTQESGINAESVQQQLFLGKLKTLEGFIASIKSNRSLSGNERETLAHSVVDHEGRYSSHVASALADHWEELFDASMMERLGPNYYSRVPERIISLLIAPNGITAFDGRMPIAEDVGRAYRLAVEDGLKEPWKISRLLKEETLRRYLEVLVVQERDPLNPAANAQGVIERSRLVLEQHLDVADQEVRWMVPATLRASYLFRRGYEELGRRILLTKFKEYLSSGLVSDAYKLLQEPRYQRFGITNPEFTSSIIQKVITQSMPRKDFHGRYDLIRVIKAHPDTERFLGKDNGVAWWYSSTSETVCTFLTDQLGSTNKVWTKKEFDKHTTGRGLEPILELVGGEENFNRAWKDFIGRQENGLSRDPQSRQDALNNLFYFSKTTVGASYQPQIDSAVQQNLARMSTDIHALTAVCEHIPKLRETTELRAAVNAGFEQFVRENNFDAAKRYGTNSTLNPYLTTTNQDIARVLLEPQQLAH